MTGYIQRGLHNQNRSLKQLENAIQFGLEKSQLFLLESRIKLLRSEQAEIDMEDVQKKNVAKILKWDLEIREAWIDYVNTKKADEEIRWVVKDYWN